MIRNLGALNGDIYATATQGFGVFNSSEYEVFRYPTGAGIAYRQGDFLRGLSLNTSWSWFGFPVMDGETGFRNSWMITGSLGVGWEFLLTADRDAQIALIPYVGVGFYTRSLTWFESTVRQSRPIVLTAVDAVLRTDNSLIFGTCLQLTGYMDRQDVWGLAVVLSAGYSYEVSE
jgi:hypothetical protein